MPTYEVEISGQKYEVEAPDEGALSIAISGLQKSKPGGRHLSYEEGAALLDKEETDGVSGAVGAGLTGFVDGFPIAGPAMLGGVQRGAAGISSLINGKSYDDNLKRAQEITSESQAAHPYITTGANIAGGVAGTIPMVAAAPGAFGMGTGSLLSRIAASTLSGGAIGGADQAVRSGGDLNQTGTGVLYGAGGGAAGPLIGKGVGAGIRYLRGSVADALSGTSKGAQQYLEQQFADPDKLAQTRAALEKLGPEATLADVSPEWLGVARGAATKPGSRDAIVDALNARSQSANARLGTDMDTHLGRPIIPSQVQRGIEASQDAVGEGYGPVMANARAVDTEALANRLDSLTANTRGPEQRALREVRSFLNIPGTDVLDPHPQALLASRRAIDGMLANEANSQVTRHLTIARREIDDMLSAAAPGIKEVDAPFSELARQSTALKQGRPILSNEAGALRPQELTEILEEGVQPQGLQVGPSAVPTRMRQGVRAEIDRAVGTQANDTNALRKIVRGQGDWNREKLGTLFGQENADRALAAIDRESIFGDTANRVTRGSDTAMGSGFGKFLDETAKGGSVPKDMTVAGATLRGGQKVLEALMQKSAEKNAAKYAADIGKLSVARGSERDAIVDALMTRADNISAATDPKIQAIVRALTQTGALQSSR